MDLNTFLTTLYVIVDDWFTENMVETVQRRGPKPQMSDSEVLTVALAGQWRAGVPWQSERSLVRYMQLHGREWFPTMLRRSAFNERVRNLWRVFIALQEEVAEWLKSTKDLYEVVDTVPLPACTLSQAANDDGHWLWWSNKGHGGTRGGWYWGEQVLLSVTPQGAITGWVIASPQADDRWLLQALISQRQGRGCLVGPPPSQPSRPSHPPPHLGPWLACGDKETTFTYLGDKAFNGWRWQDFWIGHYQVNVISVPPPNATRARTWSRADKRQVRSRCQIVETVFACLTKVFSWQALNAHSRWGQYTRVAIATAAH
ncbi:hypothetical protein ACFLYO_09100, partial [Chloroflexota bacterium]